MTPEELEKSTGKERPRPEAERPPENDQQWIDDPMVLIFLLGAVTAMTIWAMIETIFVIVGK